MQLSLAISSPGEFVISVAFSVITIVTFCRIVPKASTKRSTQCISIQQGWSKESHMPTSPKTTARAAV